MNSSVLILNLPSPPISNVCRDYAGGFGVAWHSRRRDYGQSMRPCFHPFLPYASAVLHNEGYEYSVLDCQRLRLSRSETLMNVKKRNPDVIFSLIGLPSLKKDIELLNTVKDSLPNTLIVCVGTVCRFLEKDILLGNRIDAVLRNSYPYVSNMIEVIRAFTLGHDLKTVPGVSHVKGGNMISASESPDKGLDKLPRPNYDALELDGYQIFADKSGNVYPYVPVLTGKGCSFACAYCPYPLGFGNKWTHRSPDDILSEIEYLCSRGFKGVSFRDQSFPMNKQFTTKVCEEIIRKKLDIAWVCEARVDLVSKDILTLMKKSGCKRIHYGVETGDPTLIKWGKPGVNLNIIRKAFRLAAELDLWINAHVILGSPDESLETLSKTYEFILELDPDSVNWNMLTPYPGTKLYEIAKDNNLILTYDWSMYTSHTVVMRTKYLTGSQLREAAAKTIRDYSRRKFVKLLFHARERPKLVANEIKETIKGCFI